MTGGRGAAPAVERRKLRVLFVMVNLELRGAERVALQVMRALDRERFEPDLWVMKREGGAWDEVPTDVQPAFGMGASDRIRARFPRLVSDLAARARRSDVVVGALELHPTYLAYAAGAVARRPVVGWVHNSMDRVYPRYPRGNRTASRLVYPRLHDVVFPSEGARRTLQALFPLRPERLSVIPNPVSLERLERLAAEPVPAWAEPILARPTVLGVGRLDEQKGFELLVRAHASVRARGLEHELLILGEGRARAELEALARELGVEASVHLPGATGNPFAFMRRATAFALSSRYEGFSLALLEALAVGLPAVAADCPSGPAEILREGRDGLLVPPDDPGALADGIARLLGDPALRARLSAAGPERARDFGTSRILPRWEALLLRVAGRGPDAR